MNQYLPLKFPGEPDALTELRLREELKILRTIATMHGRTMMFREKFMEMWPGTYEAEEIVEPSPYWVRQALELAPKVKERLLEVEAYFTEKGWHLPDWKRPGWLTRS